MGTANTLSCKLLEIALEQIVPFHSMSLSKKLEHIKSLSLLVKLQMASRLGL